MERVKLVIVLFLLLVLALGGISIKFYVDYKNEHARLLSQRRQYEAKISELARQKQAVEQEKKKIADELQKVKKDIQTYKRQIMSIKLEKKDLEEKYNSLAKEKSALQEDLEDLKEKYEEKVEELADLKEELEDLKSRPKRKVASEVSLPGLESDPFWADVVQKKAELEAKVEELENQLRKKEVERKEALQKKLELEIKLAQTELKNKELERQLNYARRMLAILSRDFVKEKENRRAMKEILDKMEQENRLIKDKVVKLTKSETYLEKRLSKAEEEKELLKRYLEDMDTAVRESIDQILTLADKMKDMQVTSSKSLAKSQVVDLPPIVVGSTKSGATGVEEKVVNTGLRLEGKILSVNEPHNFVVIDLGKKDGVVEGMEFDVLRGDKQIARVRVRMLKDNVCAADIIKLYGSEEIKPGDRVR